MLTKTGHCVEKKQDQKHKRLFNRLFIKFIFWIYFETGLIDFVG